MTCSCGGYDSRAAEFLEGRGWRCADCGGFRVRHHGEPSPATVGRISTVRVFGLETQVDGIFAVAMDDRRVELVRHVASTRRAGLSFLAYAALVASRRGEGARL